MPGEELTEVSLDWKQNALKCRDWESNPGTHGCKVREDTLC